jgi:hypothetical protein
MLGIGTSGEDLLDNLAPEMLFDLSVFYLVASSQDARQKVALLTVLHGGSKDKMSGTRLHESFEADDPLVFDGIGDERIQVLGTKVKAWLFQKEVESVQIFNLQADG